MKPESIAYGMQLADRMATLLRTTALTVGPPLLRLAGDKDGKRFTGLVPEPERLIAATIDTQAQKAQGPFGTPIAYLCTNCGSADIRIEAYAAWSDENQKWECQSTFIRAAECARCGPTHIMPKPLAVPSEPPRA